MSLVVYKKKPQPQKSRMMDGGVYAKFIHEKVKKPKTSPSNKKAGRKKAMGPTKAQRQVSQEERKVKVNLIQKLQTSSRGPARRNPVALAVALPYAEPVVRYSGAYSQRPTAVTKLHRVSNEDFSSAGNPLAVFQPGTFIMGVSKDPLHSTVQSYLNPGFKQYQYNGKYGDSITGTFMDGTFDFPPALSGTFDITPHLCEDNFKGDSLKLHPHGDYVYNFTQDGRHCMHLTANNNYPVTVTINLSSTIAMWSAGALAPVLVVNRWNGDKFQPYASYIFGGASTNSTINANVSKTGYYSFNVSFNERTTPVDAKAYLYYVGASDVWGFAPLPQLHDKREDIDAIRIAGASIMFSPLSATIEEQGQMLGYQIPPEGDFQNFTNFGDVSMLTGSTIMPYKKGLYGFIKPTSEHDNELTTPFVTSEDGSMYGINAPLKISSGWLMLICQVQQDGTTYPSGKLYVTTCFGVEYITTDVWVNHIPPSLDPLKYIEMMQAIRRLPQFHENPMHFRDIVSFLKKAGRGALKLAPTLMTALKVLHPEYSPLYTAIGAGASFLNS